MASATPTIRELLEGIKASEFPFTREIVCVDSKATTLDAFRTLSENHVLSAPVLDATAGKYVGFIDTSDLVKHIVETQTGVPKSPVADLRRLLAARSHTLPKEVVGLVNLSENNPFIPISSEDSLLKAAEVLANSVDGAKSVHRVPIVDAESGRVTKLVTQSAMLKFIDAHKVSIGMKLASTVTELFGKKSVITIHADAPVMDALKMMTEHKFSALPIINEEGKIITNISNSDVRLLAQRDFSVLRLSCLDFVSAVRQTMDVVSGRGRSMAATIAVKPTASLETVLAKLAATGVHRMYVVGEHDKLEGIVSLKDILKVLLAEA